MPHTAALLALAFATTIASADTLVIRGSFFIESFPNPQRRLDVTIFADLDSIVAVGQEQAIVTRATISEFLDDVGQNFSVADLTDPPDAVTPGNLVSTFNDGQLDTTRILSTVGDGYTIFREFNTGTPVVARFAGNSVAFGPCVIFTRIFNLDLATLTTEIRCTGDYDGNLIYDFTDVLAFLKFFAAEDPAADLAEPTGVFDFNDVLAFLEAFGSGCP